MCIRDRQGVDADEMLEFVRIMDPVVDLFDVNVGGWPEDSGTSRYYPEGSQLPWTSRVREATSKVIVGVGRYTNPDTMAAVIRSEAGARVLREGEAGHFVPVDVRIGQRDGEDIEIVDGLNEHDRIVVSGQFLIDSEAQLRAVLPTLDVRSNTAEHRHESRNGGQVELEGLTHVGCAHHLAIAQAREHRPEVGGSHSQRVARSSLARDGHG